MPLTFAGTLDHSAVTAAVDQLTDLVGSAEVADAWEQESALSGMTVGGLARHLVSQFECAIEFLVTPGPPDAQVLTLVGHYDRVDWLLAPVDAVENTSIRDDFNQMGSAGHAESVEALARSREHLAAAIDAAGPTTYVPWQDCALPTDDFLVVRLMEMVVHTDDLSCSVGVVPRRSTRRCSSPCSPCSRRWPPAVGAKARCCAPSAGTSAQQAPSRHSDRSGQRHARLTRK